jgi:hypothetical protein
MKALIFVAALAAVLLIGCESNATGPASFPTVSQPVSRTLPISAVIERSDQNGVKKVIEVTGLVEYSLLELMPDEAEGVAHSYQIILTLRADLKDKATQEAWKAAGFSTDRFSFTAACKKCFTKNYTIERLGSNLNVEFEIVNNNLAMSQISIPL